MHGPPPPPPPLEEDEMAPGLFPNRQVGAPVPRWTTPVLRDATMLVIPNASGIPAPAVSAPPREFAAPPESPASSNAERSLRMDVDASAAEALQVSGDGDGNAVAMEVDQQTTPPNRPRPRRQQYFCLQCKEQVAPDSFVLVASGGSED